MPAWSVTRCVGARVALAAAVAQVSAALYFHVTERAGAAPRCFIEEVPEDTLIVGYYKNPDVLPWGEPGWTGTGLRLTIQDMQRTHTYLDKSLEPSGGKFAFTSPAAGEFLLCFSTNTSSSNPRQLRVDVSLRVGEEAIDYKAVAEKEHLSELEVEVRRLVDKMKDIMKEQSYQREREAAFREATESTHNAVIYVAVAQVVIMLGSGLWQVATLRAFFARKKLA